MIRRVVPLLLLLACSRGEQQDTFPSAPVIVISIDTLRSDRLPAYGYRNVETPHLDALRADAILYERAYAHAPLTLPSHASIFTGLLPTEHGVRNNAGYKLSGHETLAATLRKHGYRTGAAVSSYVLRSETGIAEGFEFYDDEIAMRPGAATSEAQRSGFESVAAAKNWIASHANQPFFFFLHLYEPHAPYTPPEPFRAKYGDTYEGEIAAADAMVGQLLESLRASGIYDRALIVVLSDHGEALWEHGEDQHGILLYREVLQVPLLIKPPGSKSSSTIATPFPLHRVHHEVLRLSGRPSTLPSKAIYAETLYPRIHLGWSELRSLIDGDYHYIESSSPELYDLANDPGETKNLIAVERRVGAQMRRKLAEIPFEITKLGAIDPEEARKLAALGYIGTAADRSGPLPNPREKIGELKEIKHAFQLAAEKRYPEAVAALRALLERNPRLTDVSTRLGEVLLEWGRATEAVDVYRTAIAHAERVSPDLSLALAVAYVRAGRPQEAVPHARLALDSHPVQAREVLARAAIEAGSFDEALRLLDEAGPHFNIEHLRGDALARMDRPAEAVAAYQREIARFPHHAQSYANLALIHFIEGRTAEGERVLREMLAKNPGSEELARRVMGVRQP